MDERFKVSVWSHGWQLSELFDTQEEAVAYCRKASYENPSKDFCIFHKGHIVRMYSCDEESYEDNDCVMEIMISKKLKSCMDDLCKMYGVNCNFIVEAALINYLTIDPIEAEREEK